METIKERALIEILLNLIETNFIEVERTRSRQTLVATM